MSMWIFLSSQYHNKIYLSNREYLSERKLSYCKDHTKTVCSREALQRHGSVHCLQLPVWILLSQRIIRAYSLSEGNLLSAQFGIGKAMHLGRVPR